MRAQTVLARKTSRCKKDSPAEGPRLSLQGQTQLSLWTNALHKLHIANLSSCTIGISHAVHLLSPNTIPTSPSSKISAAAGRSLRARGRNEVASSSIPSTATTAAVCGATFLAFRRIICNCRKEKKSSLEICFSEEYIFSNPL